MALCMFELLWWIWLLCLQHHSVAFEGTLRTGSLLCIELRSRCACSHTVPSVASILAPPRVGHLQRTPCRS